MTSAEVAELSRQVDLGALRDYRNAVGRRTREIVSGFNERDWEGEIAAASLERAAALGGWKTEKMMRRYAAVTDQTLRAAAEAGSGVQYGTSGRHELREEEAQ